MSRQIDNKPLLGSPKLCDYILQLLANGTNIKTMTCSVLFEQDDEVKEELKRAGITVKNSKFWWGRFKGKERSDIEKVIIGIPAERIRLSAAMTNGAGGSANANA
jgi:hypothetical protein